MRKLWRLVGGAGMACAAGLAAADNLMPYRMPWNDTSDNLTNLSSWNRGPAGQEGFVRIQGGHLYAGNQRLRLLGVNVVFGSVAPEHAVADQLAARLARFGVNIVRMHHMDSAPAPRGLLQKDMRTLDPAMLERFDYFVAALKREGIYVDLNLHVGRRYPGFLDWGETTPKYWKGVDNFYPPMLDMQKEYAEKLLRHLNPYTGNRYASEPAVALVEINNENGLMREWRSGALDEMTEPYRGSLQALWTGWLRRHYESDADLARSWGVRDVPAGPEMFGSRSEGKSGEAGWNLQLVGDAGASLSHDAGGALDLAITRPGKENWHVQLHQNGLAFQAGEPYTLHLRMRAEPPMRVGLQAMQAHEPWRSLWSQEVKVAGGWQDYVVTFAPEDAEDKARFTIGRIGRQIGHLYVQAASLHRGGRLGWREGESLQAGNLAVPAGGTLQSMPRAAQRDWLQFLWDTETAYWQGMRDYLRHDLGVRAAIVGTQVSYSPAPIQAGLDVVDGHAYWQHPVFPGKPWDLDDWRIANTPMAGVDNAGTLADLALRRVPGKPFIVTEYNHPFPSLYQAEALPLVAAYAALQDWDGVFLYSYGAHRENWDPGFVENFFDSGANPVKMSSLVPAAALFRREDVRAASVQAQGGPSQTQWLDAWRQAARVPGADAFGAPRTAVLAGAASVATPAGQSKELPVASDTGQLVWGLPGVGGGRLVVVDTPRSKALIGARSAAPVDLHGVRLELTHARNDWGVILVTLMQGEDFSSSANLLLTLLGQEENTGQRWLDAQKTTLGRNFGTAPVLVESIGARIVLPLPARRVRAWALDERGARREEIPVTGTDHAVINIDGHQHSLWYEVEQR